MSSTLSETGRTDPDEKGIHLVSFDIEVLPDPDLITFAHRVLEITKRLILVGDVRLTPEEEAWITVYEGRRWVDLQAQIAMELGIGETRFENQQGKQELFTFKTARAGRYNNFQGSPAAEFITELTGNTVAYMDAGKGLLRSKKDYPRAWFFQQIC